MTHYEHTPIDDLFDAASRAETCRVAAFMVAYTIHTDGTPCRVLVEVSRHGWHLPGGKAIPDEFEPATSETPAKWFHDRTLLRELNEENGYAASVFTALADPFDVTGTRYHQFDDGVKRNVNEHFVFGRCSADFVPRLYCGESETLLVWMHVSDLMRAGNVRPESCSGALRFAMSQLGRMVRGEE